MISMRAFADEVEKIAATKCRSGSVPIHVHNLTKKDVHDKRDFKKTSSSLGERALQTLGTTAAKHPGKTAIGLVGGGIASWEAGKQAVNDLRLGREIRKQQGM